jgi:hypothetical protein
MKNSIKVKCIEKFTLHNSDFTKLLADVEIGEYTAELYENTEEYFAKDSEGREFLVGEINIDEKLVLEQNFELIED